MGPTKGLTFSRGPKGCHGGRPLFYNVSGAKLKGALKGQMAAQAMFGVLLLIWGVWPQFS